MTITLYSAPGCGCCRATALWLKSHHINFNQREFDVQNEDQERATTDKADLTKLAAQFHASSFPIVVLIDEKQEKVLDFWSGSFNPVKLQQLA